MSKADIEKLKDFGKKLENSGADYSEVTLRDIFTQAGLNSDLTERAIKDYQRYRESEFSFLSPLSGDEIRQIGAEALAEKVWNLKRGVEIVEDILRNYLRYLNYKKQIAETYQESKDWAVVFYTSVYSDVEESQESFIDYVEETYKTKVKDGKHLRELTGITEETLEGLDEIVINSSHSKYFRSLEKALQEGAKYKDLLQIKPQDFGLPNTWRGCLGSDQYSSILWALSFEFMINEPGLLMLLPDFRSIAKEVEAPYSVIMDCYNLTNKGKPYGGVEEKIKVVLEDCFKLDSKQLELFWNKYHSQTVNEIYTSGINGYTLKERKNIPADEILRNSTPGYDIMREILIELLGIELFNKRLKDYGITNY